jgi:hypothetical protein
VAGILDHRPVTVKRPFSTPEKRDFRNVGLRRARALPGLVSGFQKHALFAIRRPYRLVISRPSGSKIF